MKRRLLAALAAVVIMFAGASTASAEFRYGPSLGLTYNDLMWKQDLFTVDKTMGFSAGIIGEKMFPGIGFGVDIGLFYEMRGAKLHMGEKPMWEYMGLGTVDMRLHTLVIPVHVRFKYTRLNGVEDKIAPLLFLGPSLGILVGHSDSKGALKYSGADLGLDFGLGAEIFRKWQVTAGYTLGVTEACKGNMLTNFTARNSVWTFKVSYLF